LLSAIAHTKAQSAYEEALEIYRTLAKTNPDAYLSEMAMTLNGLGLLYPINFQGFFISALCFCVCVVVIVKHSKIVECHCHLR
jgi:hypothetical protein